MSEYHDEERSPAAERPPSWIEVAKSVGAAFFGVQTEAKRRRDFAYGRLRDYVLVGVVATIAFVLLLIGVVQLILASAGV